MGENEYLTIKEAAKRLKRHPHTIWMWTQEEKIEFHQTFPRAKILIPLSEVLRLTLKEDDKESKPRRPSCGPENSP
jgi:excisionase family DNA binding protein